MDSNLLPPAPGTISRPASHCMGWVLLLACAVSSGCATAINGMTQRVAVASDPPGAQVYVNDAPAGVTPGFVDVPRRDPDLELRLEKEGYEPTVFPLERSRSGWSWGNVLFAGVPINEYTLEMWVGAMAVYGVLGSLWDAVRGGGAYKRPDLVRATLDPIPPVNETTAEVSARLAARRMGRRRAGSVRVAAAQPLGTDAACGGGPAPDRPAVRVDEGAAFAPEAVALTNVTGSVTGVERPPAAAERSCPRPTLREHRHGAAGRARGPRCSRMPCRNGFTL